MPTTFGPEAQAGLQQVITEQLVREFTVHSRPEVTVNHSLLNDAYEVRVRIFGDLHVVHMFEDRMHDYPGDRQAAYARVFDHVVRNIVNHIRRAPAVERTAPGTFRFTFPRNSGGPSDSGNQSELGDQPVSYGVAPSRGDIGASSRYERVQAALFRPLMTLPGSSPAPKPPVKPKPKTRWQRLLGEDLV